MANNVKEITIRLASNYDGAGVRAAEADIARLQTGLKNAKPINLLPLNFGRDQGPADVNKGVADAIRDARAQVAAKNRAFDVGGFDPVAEARARFAATKRSIDDVRGSTEAWTDKLIKGAIIVKSIHGAIELASASMSLLKAQVADTTNNFKEAATGYLKFANTVKEIPIVGQIAFAGADLISGGAASAADKALKDAAANDAHTARMGKDREATKRAVQDQIADRNADMQSAEDADLAHRKLQRDRNIRDIQDKVKNRELDATLAKQAIAAENDAYRYAKDERTHKERFEAMKTAEEERLAQKKSAEQAAQDKIEADKKARDTIRDQAVVGYEDQRDIVDKQLDALRKQQDKFGPANVVLPSAQSARLLTGVVNASHENNPQAKLEKEAQQQTKYLESIKQNMDDWIKYLQRHGTDDGVIIIPVNPAA